MTNYLRPDEQASFSRIERSQKRDESLKKGAKTTFGLASTLAVGGALAPSLAPKILPFLSKYIPANLSVQGISKVSPVLGNFLKKGISMGLPVEAGLDFIKNQIISEEESKAASKPPKENRNIIEQYSPELHKFILEQVKSGRSPLEAGALAFQDQKGGAGFKKIIEKLVKDHKTPWASIIEAVYGSPNMAQPQQPTQAAPQPQGAQSPQQGQPQGQGQQALMSILQKIQQARGAQ